MDLVIAEKPSLAKSIRAAVGSKYTVTNAFGHIYELAGPDEYLPSSVPLNKRKDGKVWRIEDLPIIPAQWIRHPKRDASDQIKEIKKLLKGASLVINAGDPDREGQLLIDEILEELGYKGPVKRVWLTSLTPEGIQAAFAKMRDNREYRPLRDAADVRSKADWLVGMNLTRAWTVRNHVLISVGRVQTPTLALVVRRDLEIESFVPKDYFEVVATVKHANGTFAARWKPRSADGPGFDSEGRLTDRRIAEQMAALGKGQGRIEQYKAEPKKQGAPLPFSLSALQKAASAKLSLGAKQVLDLAQELYESQYTTYPRTDCQYLGEDQLDEVYKAASKLAPGYKVQVSKTKHAAFNDAKVTAHTAIVPTGKDASSLSGNAARLYDMIARATVALFMPPQEYMATSVVVGLGGEQWAASGKRVLKAGWKALYGGQDADEDDEDRQPALPEMARGDPATGVSAEVKGLQTKPPARFTEGTLIDAMANIHRYIEDAAAKAKLKETSGIGTEATRANIIETLFKRGWIERKGKSKNIISTSSGRAVVAALPVELTDPVTTARWEDFLSSVAEGKLDAGKFQEAIEKFVKQQLGKVGETQMPADPSRGGKGSASAERVTAPCPVCGQSARRLESSKRKGYFFWACENRDHPPLQDDGGKPGEPFPNKK